MLAYQLVSAAVLTSLMIFKSSLFLVVSPNNRVVLIILKIKLSVATFCIHFWPKFSRSRLSWLRLVLKMDGEILCTVALNNTIKTLGWAGRSSQDASGSL